MRSSAFASSKTSGAHRAEQSRRLVARSYRSVEWREPSPCRRARPGPWTARRAANRSAPPAPECRGPGDGDRLGVPCVTPLDTMRQDRLPDLTGGHLRSALRVDDTGRDGRLEQTVVEPAQRFSHSPFGTGQGDPRGPASPPPARRLVPPLGALARADRVGSTDPDRRIRGPALAAPRDLRRPSPPFPSCRRRSKPTADPGFFAMSSSTRRRWSRCSRRRRTATGSRMGTAQ